jgi:hypothetical protein
MELMEETARVTRLGIFFILSNFLLWAFFYFLVVQTFGQLFSRLKLCISFAKEGWATLWAIFFTTHPVTL